MGSVVIFACCSLFCPRGGGHNCGFYCASKRHALTCCICTYILLLYPFCCCLQGLWGISSTHGWQRLLRFKKKEAKRLSCYIYSLKISLWSTVHKNSDEKVNGDKSIKIQKPYLIYFLATLLFKLIVSGLFSVQLVFLKSLWKSHCVLCYLCVWKMCLMSSNVSGVGASQERSKDKSLTGNCLDMHKKYDLVLEISQI